MLGSGGSFGGSSLQQEIGLGQAARIKALEILWPGTGAVDRFSDVPIDRVLLIKEGISTLMVIDP